ncbi:Kelch-like protein 3, variant 2 [Clonorchis sinensis]|uniref:Kelch-like protein 3, variant 2 n=1 Tax=Clonorchis sinensis TaxID=79923 RepID=A0A8T1N4G6_CLOSI|nr:Kelch-like protein 3, variant 2 [Clonorchis sinensis]
MEHNESLGATENDASQDLWTADNDEKKVNAPDAKLNEASQLVGNERVTDPLGPNNEDDISGDSFRRKLATLHSINIKFPNSQNIKTGSEESLAASGSDGLTYKDLDSEAHRVHQLLAMNRLREEQKYCDLVVRCGQNEFPAHSNILAASSDYFDRLLSEGNSSTVPRVVEIQGVDQTVLADLINFIYTGKLRIATDTVQNLMIGAHILQLNEVLIDGSQFLTDRLHPTNWVDILRFADLLKNEQLVETCRSFSKDHLNEVLEEGEQLGMLNLEQFTELISTTTPNVSEERRFNAIRSWVSYDPRNREQSAAELCQFVHIPGLPRNCLQQLYDTKEQWKNTSWLSEFLLEALNNPVIGQSKQTTYKPFSSGKEGILLVFDGHEEYIQVYDIQTQEWKPTAEERDNQQTDTGRQNMVPDLPEKREGCAAVVFNGLVYVLGGRTPEITFSVLILDPVQQSWKDGPPMDTPRWCLGAAVLGGKIYAVGGSDPFASSALNSVEVLDPSTDTWLPISPMSCCRSSLGVATVRGKLYAVGGYNTSGPIWTVNCLPSAESYDPETDTWTAIAPMNFPRYGLRACELNDRLYAVGGAPDLVRTLNVVEVYNLDTNSWHRASGMIENRSQFASNFGNIRFERPVGCYALHLVSDLHPL